MLVKIFSRGTGAGKGPVQYCISESVPELDPRTGKRAGGTIVRNPPPVIVKGDAERTTTLIDSSQNRWKYTSGVLAFADTDQPTEAEQLAVIESFETSFYAGLDPDQFDVLWTRHEHEGNVELHFVTPRLELTTGKALNIAPPGYETMMSAWRDAWNYSKGWASPDEPDRAQLTKQSDHVLKIDKALMLGGLPTSEDPKRLIGEYLANCIENGTVKNRADVIAMLVDVGLEINRQGKDYISVRPKLGAKPVRLKGALYDERLEITYDRANAIRAELGISSEPGGPAESQDGGTGWRNPDADRIRVTEASEKLNRFIAARTKFNEGRYRVASRPDYPGAGIEERSVANNADGHTDDLANSAPDRQEIHRPAAATDTRNDPGAEQTAFVVDEVADAGTPGRLPGRVRRDLRMVDVSDQPGGPAATEHAPADQAIDHAVLPDTGRAEVLPADEVTPWYDRIKTKIKELYDRTRTTIIEGISAAIDAVRLRHEALGRSELSYAGAATGFSAAVGRADKAYRDFDAVARATEQRVGRGVKMIKQSQGDELERFKSQINFVEYAESVGYRLDTRESSNSSKIMRRDNDKIIVATAADGHGIYCSVKDDNDQGSIIDFVQKREGANLGQVRKILRPWVNGAPATYAPKATAADRLKPVSTTADRQQIAAIWAKMQPTPAGHPYLTTQREIDPAIQANHRFAGMVRIDAKQNAVFPHCDQDGITGYELKSATFTGFAAGGEKSLWHSTNLHHAQRIVIVEGAIDALSHAEINKDVDSAYISVGGQMSDKQRQLLADCITALKNRNGMLILATDNDQAGEALATQISGLVPGMLGIRQTPQAKDWNDVLIGIKRNAMPVDLKPAETPRKPPTPY